LITRGKEAQWRPCRLEAAPLKDVDGWLDRYRRFWEESFDRLDEYLRELQLKTKQQAGKPVVRKRRSRSIVKRRQHGRTTK